MVRHTFGLLLTTLQFNNKVVNSSIQFTNTISILQVPEYTSEEYLSKFILCVKKLT
ncbi:hypothetical protein SAMN03003324_02845 [Pedobacter antarcticus]|uniref:Uncharacterized protein n=1 Tax=Pedobacter antarcticus TaxID=34086 RepID=A0A1I2GRS0_9SPHI|nr:hypothetical protein SAMN03003324_02845 [Pedobacter antarcticus]